MEQYSNEKSFSDGQIYLQIRHYQSLPDEFAEKRWRSYLTPDKWKILRRFLEHNLAKKLDTLRPIPGMWGQAGDRDTA